MTLTLEELFKLIKILEHMKAEEWEKRDFIFEYKTQIYAHRWWNFDENPPAEYYYSVKEYIKCHPDEFKGAGPQ